MRDPAIAMAPITTYCSKLNVHTDTQKWHGAASSFLVHPPFFTMVYDSILNLATDYKKIQQLEDWDGYCFFTL